jgi:uncharacterized protein
VPMAIKGTTTHAGQAWPTHLPGLVAPALAAVLVTAVVSGRAGLADLGRRVVRVRVGVRWYVLVLATLGVGALAVAVQGLAGQGWPSTGALSTYSGAATMPWLALAVFAFVVNGLGEETGWRGFLVDRLAPRLGLVRTALAVAAVWAPWHLPLFWVSQSFADFGLPGTIGWLVSITAGSVVLTWVYLGSGRSIWLVALWHTSFNLVTATGAGDGLAGPVVSAAVIVAAVVVVRHAQVADHGSTPAADRAPGQDAAPGD